MDEPTVTIYLVEKDAERFKEFQKHYELFNLLIEKKVFDQKAASVTLTFDPQGGLSSIARHDFLFVTGKKFDNTNPKVL